MHNFFANTHVSLFWLHRCCATQWPSDPWVTAEAQWVQIVQQQLWNLLS